MRGCAVERLCGLVAFVFLVCAPGWWVPPVPPTPTPSPPYLGDVIVLFPLL
jgi:hypothetical protein